METVHSFKNPHRITLKQPADEHLFASVEEMLEAASTDSVVPVCCDTCYEIEPDGRCEHGCPSVLLAAGLI